MKRFLLLIATTTILGACGGSGQPHYPANVERAFINGCSNGSNATYCKCALSYAEAHVSFDKFKSDSESYAKTGVAPEWAYQAFSECKWFAL